MRRRQPRLEALQAVTAEGIRRQLGRGGQVNWLDRGLIGSSGLDPDFRLLAITGRARSGKTREAIELVRRTIADGQVAADRLYAPGPAFRMLTVEGLRYRLEEIKATAGAPLLLLFDDLAAYLKDDDGLARMNEVMAVLGGLDPVYVVATVGAGAGDAPTVLSARVLNACYAWLDAHSFDVFELPDLDEGLAGRLVDVAAATFGLQIDDAARAELVEGGDGTPEQVVASLRCLRAGGATHVDQETARRVAGLSLEQKWAEVRRRVVGQAPAAAPLLQSLATFRAAGVGAATPLVLDYGAHLHQPGGGRARASQVRNELEQALANLGLLDVVAQRDQVYFPDLAVEGLVDPAGAAQVLARFLDAPPAVSRWPARQRAQRRAQRTQWDAGTQMVALFELALGAGQRNELASEVAPSGRGAAVLSSFRPLQQAGPRPPGTGRASSLC